MGEKITKKSDKVTSPPECELTLFPEKVSQTSSLPSCDALTICLWERKKDLIPIIWYCNQMFFSWEKQLQYCRHTLCRGCTFYMYTYTLVESLWWINCTKEKMHRKCCTVIRDIIINSVSGSSTFKYDTAADASKHRKVRTVIQTKLKVTKNPRNWLFFVYVSRGNPSPLTENVTQINHCFIPSTVKWCDGFHFQFYFFPSKHSCNEKWNLHTQ